ncbi:hypothetical protein IX327_001977 [Porphyromonas levii]|nr:hypothetical protein [Porphyromonas levii]
MFHNKLILDDLNIATQRRGSPPYNNFLYAICLFCITICSSMEKKGGGQPSSAYESVSKVQNCEGTTPAVEA